MHPLGNCVFISSKIACCQFHTCYNLNKHYSDVIMGAMASQITSLAIACSTVCSGADQRKHQSSASLASVRGIHRWTVNSPHKGPVKRKRFPCDDVILFCLWRFGAEWNNYAWRKCFWKCRVPNGDHFVQASICLPPHDWFHHKYTI